MHREGSGITLLSRDPGYDAHSLRNHELHEGEDVSVMGNFQGLAPCGFLRLCKGLPKAWTGMMGGWTDG